MAEQEGMSITASGQTLRWQTAPDAAWSLWGSHSTLGRTLHVYVLAESQAVAREAAHAWAEEQNWTGVVWPTWDAKPIAKLSLSHGLPVLVAHLES